MRAAGCVLMRQDFRIWHPLPVKRQVFRSRMRKIPNFPDKCQWIVVNEFYRSRSCLKFECISFIALMNFHFMTSAWKAIWGGYISNIVIFYYGTICPAVDLLCANSVQHTRRENHNTGHVFIKQPLENPQGAAPGQRRFFISGDDLRASRAAAIRPRRYPAGIHPSADP